MNYAFTIKVVSFSLIHKRSIILFENSPRITIYFAMDLLSFLRFLELFRFIALNSPHVSIYYLFRNYPQNSPFVREYSMNINDLFQEFVMKYYIFHELTMNSLPIRGDTMN